MTTLATRERKLRALAKAHGWDIYKHRGEWTVRPSYKRPSTRMRLPLDLAEAVFAPMAGQPLPGEHFHDPRTGEPIVR
jgi:hypothetical protein